MISKDKKGYHCWVTNLTKRDIGIGDLGVEVKSMTTVDLLSPGHSYLTVSRIKKSMESGSLKRRKDQKSLIIRFSKPELIERKIEVSKVTFPGKYRSSVKFEEKVYKELEVGGSFDDDDKFAENMADIGEDQHTAAIQINREKE